MLEVRPRAEEEERYEGLEDAGKGWENHGGAIVTS